MSAYSDLEDALIRVCEEEGHKGVPTEWVIVTSSQFYDDEGTHITQVGTLVPPDEATPTHRIMGLLEYALVRYRKYVEED